MKAVVLAAGEGVRLKPLTLTKPKHLLPVGNQPLLFHTLKSISKTGVRDVILVIGYLGEMIRKSLSAKRNLGMKISYVLQEHLGGTGEALYLTSALLGDEDFLFVYGDLYLNPSVVQKILRVYKKRKADVLGVVEVDKAENYGVVKADEDGRLMDLVEKPEKPPSNLANAGIYVFRSDVFTKLEKVGKSVRGEIEVTDAVRQLASEKDVYTVKIDAKEWLDIGRPWDLLEANERFLKDLKKSSLKGEIEVGVHIKAPVQVEKDAIIKTGSYIEGPAFIGRGSIIGPNSYIRAYTSIGSDVKIGNACEVKNSIIMNGSKIPHLSYIGDSIIGESCNFGAGTLIGNLRLDERPVKMMIKTELVDTGRKKLGVIVGDNVHTGVNVSLMPGVKIGPGSHIGPNVVVERDVPENSKVLLHQRLSAKKV